MRRWATTFALFDCVRIAGGLVELARAKKANRLLVSGDAAAEMLAVLRRPGFASALSKKACGLPRGQFDVALVAWQDHSIKALEMPGIWVGSVELGVHQRLKMALDRLGFRIESGSRVEHGIAVCAQRLEIVQAAKAA